MSNLLARCAALAACCALAASFAEEPAWGADVPSDLDMGVEVPPLFDDPDHGKATLLEPMELEKDLPDHIPRNASMARELAAICYRRGWYYGYSGSYYTCTAGYRLPTASEWSALAGCYTTSDSRIFSYYRHVAVSPPSGCGCKWSTSYCRYPSVNTFNGRMCGNYYQLVLCISQCYATPPTAPANAYKRSLSVTQMEYGCNAGYYGARNTYTCSGPAWSGPGMPSCTLCPIGSYCAGSSQTTALPCAAGYFGTATGLTSSACSGACTAGYYCPAGSRTSTPNQCGGSGQYYCPTGSPGPVTCPGTGYYTVPLTNPVYLRTGIAACPAGRSCANGLILPGVDYSAVCPVSPSTTVDELTANKDFGPLLRPTAPGCTVCALTYSITAATADATCSPAVVAGAITFNSASGYLRTVNTNIAFANCPSGFSVTVTATRTDGSGLSGSCTANVAVAQVPRSPIIHNCSASLIKERSAINSLVATNISATSPNFGVTLLWSFPNTTGIPFAVSGCDAVVRVTQYFTYNPPGRSVYNIPLTVTQLGLPGVPLNSTCILSIPIERVLLPPLITTDTFIVPEASPAGFFLGNVGVYTQADGTDIARVYFSANDTRNAFQMDRWGNVTVGPGNLAVLNVQSQYKYNVTAVTTGGKSATWPIIIILSPVPQPAVTRDQARSISEGADSGFIISPRLDAIHPQGVAFNFTTISDGDGPSTVFGLTLDGYVYLLPGQTLSYATQDSYTYTFYIIDANQLVAFGRLDIEVTELNHPPVWAAPLFNMSMDEYSAPGSIAYTLFNASDGAEGNDTTGETGIVRQAVLLSASNVNPRMALGYGIISTRPAEYVQYLTVDTSGGAISIVPVLPSPFTYNRAANYSAPLTVMVNVSATSYGVPPMAAYASVALTIESIRPRINPLGQVFMPGLFAAGDPVVTMTAWSPYPGIDLNWTIITNDINALNQSAFTMDQDTGVLRFAVASNTFLYNVRNRFSIVVGVSDEHGQNGSASVDLNLAHANQPPVWGTVARMYAAAVTLGNIGSPLSTFVTDVDTQLGIGEFLTFSFASGKNGNTDGTFGINNVTGQIYVANVTATAFQYPAGAQVAPTFNLTVVVTDAGIDGPRYSISKNITIELTTNTFAPQISYYNFTVDELVAPGTLVGIVKATTVNTGYVLTYSISGAGPNAYSAFPFRVVDVADGSTGSARLETTAVAPIDFNEGFQRYYATLTVTDNNPRTPMSNSTAIDIYVRLVQRPPFFDRVARTPNATVFWLSIKEHSGAGINVTDTPLTASSKDPWQRPLLVYRVVNPSPYVSLHPNTAVLTTTAAFPALDYNAVKWINVTIEAKDLNGLTDYATVRIAIQEVNKPAVFNPFTDASGVRTVSTLSVRENATLSTVVGYVTATDPNVYFLWRARNYAILPVDDGALGFFGIHASTGAVYVAAAGALDWWDQATFILTVTCTDSDPFAPITVNTTVQVDLIQVNRVVVTGFFVDAAAPPSVAVNITGLPGQMQAQFRTLGFTQRWLYITGSGFGRTARRLAAEGRTPSYTNVTARFGPLGSGFTATCGVAQPNTLISCAVPEGAGTSHTWTVTIDGAWTAVSTSLTGFFAPTISNVFKVGGVIGDASTQTLNTRGGDSVEVTATNVGPTGTLVYLAYGRQSVTTGYESNFGSTAPCTWVMTQAVVRCPTVTGIGANLKFALQVAYQPSPAFTGSVVRYRTPVVTNVTAPILATAGGQRTLVIDGDQFGPTTVSATDVMVTYAKDFSDGFYTTFVASGCAITTGHTRIICDSAPGVGANLTLRVTIGAQTSNSSVQTVSYMPPVVAGLAGTGKELALTVGGQDIVIRGSSFGPLTRLYANGSAIRNDLQPVAVYGVNGVPQFVALDCRVTSLDTTISCLTAEGYGHDLLWSVIVGGQKSPVYMLDSSSYHPPIVASYANNGSDNALTEGMQAVDVAGSNFGPAGTPLDMVTYGNDVNGTDFMAANCSLVVPHKLIQCWTVPGAGAGLKWKITIGGQGSVSPTTAYGAPVIESFAGTALVDASTDGGDYILINGAFFSLQKYLDYVTYGPSGSEFSARGCLVSIPHKQLNCTLPAGVGRSLKWYISVGRQLSRLSELTTSYAQPNILSVTPANATTDARPNGQDVFLTVDGTDFALRYPAAQPVVMINNNRITAPPKWDLDAHWESVRAGGTGLQNVASWISQLTTLYPTTAQVFARSRHRIGVKLPEGFGQRVEMFAVVGGVPSNITYFTYTPPVIRNVAPDRQNVTQGFLRVFIEGSSFCNGMHGCGTLYLNNISVPFVQWSHNQIMLVAPDPSADALPSTLQVEVDGVRSNIGYFKKPMANINALVSQGQWTAMDTRGGEPFYVRGVLDIVGVNESVSVSIGGRPCTNQWAFVDNGKPPTDTEASFTLNCFTPPGVGTGLHIVLVFQNVTSRENPSFSFSYDPPYLQSLRMSLPFFDVDLATAALNASYVHDVLMAGVDLGRAVLPQFGVPTLGAIVVVNGSGMGTADLGTLLADDPLGMALPTVVYQEHLYSLLVVPPGDGVYHSMRVRVGGQASNMLPFTYSPPTVTSVTPNHGPTLGGIVLNITGFNFGVSRPTVYVGGVNCSLVEPWMPSANHSFTQCILPAGQGRNLAITVVVNGQSSTLPAVPFHYDPPIVWSVDPATGPTSGRLPGPLLPDGLHRAPGDRVLQMIQGQNFGLYGRVSYLPYAGSDPLARNWTVANQDILSWNDSTIIYYMPQGIGDHLIVNVFASQESVSSVEFSYDPPSIEAVSRFDRPPAACRSVETCFTFGNTTRCRVVPAGCYDTRGGYPLEIVGQSFGIQSLIRTFTQITVGGRPCVMSGDPMQVAALSHERLVCQVPTGLGEDLPVVVTLGLRSSVLTNTSVFSYDPPVVSVMSPNTPDAMGGMVQFRGKNFGFDATPLSITINDQECTTEEWLNDAQMRCQTPPQLVGAKNVSILVANRTSPYTYYDVEEALVYQCAKDYYGMEGEVCLECPQGATCPGAERFIDLVNATTGFWRINATSKDGPDTDQAVMFCAPERRESREFCPLFLPCGPPEACLAGNICMEGYEGTRCAYCLKGKYYRVNDQCVKCPNNMYMLYAGIACIILLVTAFGYYLNKMNINLAIIAIGVDYAQVVSMFARTKIRWPTLLRQLFQILSAFNLNIEITAPECLNPEIQFWQKWFVVESLPLAVIFLMGVVFSTQYVYKTMFLNINKAARTSHLPQYISTFIVLYRVAFLMLTRTSFDVLNCTPTDPPTFRDTVKKTGSIEYMSGMVQPEYECWQPHSWQLFLFPFGVGTLVVYTFAVPGVALWFLRKNRDTIKADQILRARGLGNTILENRNHGFRIRWQKLYYHYLPGKWYWEFCITARKIFIAGITLAFRQVPSYQLAIALLVLFVAYVTHVVNWPYMSHTTSGNVIPEHEAKALYDPLHARIQSEIQDTLRKNFKSRRQVNVFGARQVNPKDAFPNAVLLTMFDANFVESVLLGCCVLVSLAGIMLDSKRFDGDNFYIPSVAREFTGLTYGCLMLISSSLVFYVFVFSIEMMLSFCPEAVPKILGICCKKKVEKAAANDRAKTKALQQASVKNTDGGMTVNPIALRQTAEAALTDDPTLGEKGILAVSAVKGTEAPNAALWKAVQSSYDRLMTMVVDLRTEVRSAKQAADMAAERAGTDVPQTARRAAAQRTRTNFSPMKRAGDDSTVISGMSPLAVKRMASSASASSPGGDGAGADGAAGDAAGTGAFVASASATAALTSSMQAAIAAGSRAKPRLVTLSGVRKAQPLSSRRMAVAADDSE